MSGLAPFDTLSTNDLPPIWIVSLEGAVERRTRVAAAFSSLGLSFELVNAVDGDRLSTEDVAQYSRRRAVFNTGRGLACGELGVSLSHIRLYQRMVNESVPHAAIFEDDAEPQGALRDVLMKTELFPQDWQVITFHSMYAWSEPEPVGSPPIIGNHRVCSYRRTPLGAQGYLINLDGAQKVLDAAIPVSLPLDELLFRRRPAGLVRYGIEPAVVTHADVESEISRRGEPIAGPSALRSLLDPLLATAGRIQRRMLRAFRQD
jgi:glycosyl transferase family 25